MFSYNVCKTFLEHIFLWMIWVSQEIVTVRNQKSIHLLNHFQDGLSAPDTESNSERLFKSKEDRRRNAVSKRSREKKSTGHGEGEVLGGITDFFFIFLDLFQRDPEPLPRPPAEPQPSREQRYTGSTPTAAGSSGAPRREREEKKKCVRMWKRERETLDDRQSFSGGIRHSKTQQREVEY